MRRALLLCVTVAMAACGAGGGEQGTPTDVTIGGAVPGHVDTAMVVQGAADCVYPEVRSAGRLSVMGIRISSSRQVCSLAQSGDWEANETLVDIQLGIFTQGLEPARWTTGSYSVTGNPYTDENGDMRRGLASVFWTGEACTQNSTVLPDAGTVTITSISDARVTGIVDLSRSDPPVTGTFSAVPCTVPTPDICHRLYPLPSLVCRP